MAPRVNIVSALRQGVSAVKTSTAPLTTTAAPQALRDLNVGNRSILNIDQNEGTNANPTAAARSLVSLFQARPRGVPQDRKSLEQQVQLSHRTDDHMRQMPRRWNIGDVYSPHDMSPSEMGKWRKTKTTPKDLVDLLGIRPVDMYRNFSMISEFITSHGRIKKGSETGLRPANQRKMAKAIRRAIGLGLHPSVHKHPELLMRGSDRITMGASSGQRSQRWF